MRAVASRFPITHHAAPRPLQSPARLAQLPGLFRAIDEGNAGLNIPAYNGDLFAADPTLDALQVPDEACAHIKDLGDYDYRPAREVADADENTEVRSVIDVDIVNVILGSLHHHDLRLLHGLWDQLKKGDILLGDRAYGEYTTLATGPRQGVDVVARLHARRKVDFRKARRLGKNDGLFVWTKGYQQSEILCATEWSLLPAQITVRIIRFTATIRGFRARRITLVTTLLDPSALLNALRRSGLTMPCRRTFVKLWNILPGGAEDWLRRIHIYAMREVGMICNMTIRSMIQAGIRNPFSPWRLLPQAAVVAALIGCATTETGP